MINYAKRQADIWACFANDCLDNTVLIKKVALLKMEVDIIIFLLMYSKFDCAATYDV